MESSNPPKPPRRKASDKAEAILKGAMQEIMASGYAAASMDRIAAASGVSKPTLYNYFQDKESLFITLIEKLVKEKFQDFFSPQYFQEPLPPGKGEILLRQLAKKIVEDAVNQPEFLDFMRIIVGESGRFPELARTFTRTIKVTAFESITHLFANCPELKTHDPEVAARIFLGTMVHYVITQKLLHGEDILPMDSDRLIDGLIDCLTRSN
ncbi:TetR/AcrR family transcriptional regulator [Limnoraphis robusta]|uniref:TetR family transcriptional regulator n=1 Tax=Limnoraphis robusta CS-951 TaxID=1637645 RepID=A0A0F5Y9X2_9CYAN|nr:TetR/AcrR family transcriptional regulator [Limnoraphis robusta]KKD35558.1 TetR family transcriptional regulator [Limnoraphis robusta CS-951]